MKSLIMLVIGLVLFSQANAQHLDGAYLADPNYGGPGDTVIDEVKAQIALDDKNAAKAVAIQRGDKEGDLRAAQQARVDSALYSWVQACYLAEMGRLADKAGNAEQAVADYKKAKAAAEIAVKVDCNEAAKTKKSHEQGEIILKVIKRALKRLGVED